MKRILFSLLLCCTIASAALGQRTALPVDGGTLRYFGTIAVGSDNLTRVVWYCYSWPLYYPPASPVYTSGEVRVDTYDSAGKLLTTGSTYGPFSGWSTYPSIAVGPYDDVHLGWINQSAKQLSLWYMNGNTNSYISSSAPSYNNPDPPYSPSLLSISMDSGDNVWYDVTNPDPGNEAVGEHNAYLWQYNSSGTRAQGYGLSDAQVFGSAAVRTDGTPLQFGTGDFGTISNFTFIQYPQNTPQGGYIYNTLIGRGPIADALGNVWFPIGITTTPNNHTQLWWEVWDGTKVVYGAWDINPDGNVGTISGNLSGANWLIISMAANAFGGDGNVRALWYNDSSGQYLLQTYNPSTWSLVQNGWINNNW